MLILLLGGNGLLGHNVARQLLSQGHGVRALLRRVESLHLEHDRLQKLRGSMLDGNALMAAAEGCDAIINCAGATDMSLLRLEDYHPANRDVIRLIAHAMESHGIRTLVHTSTANTIGYGSPHHWATEEEPMESPFAESYYAQSKLEGESLVAELAARHADWHIITVNPGFMLGGSDWRNSSGKLLKASYRKPLMLAPRGGKSFVAVRDAAQAIANALTMGRNGERYLLTGHNMSLKNFYLLQAQVCRYRQVILSPPNWLMLALARIGDLLRLMHIPTQLSTRNVRQLLVYEYYLNTKARTQLSMPSSPIEDAIREYFDRSEW